MPEVRCIVLAMAEAEEEKRVFRLGWSRWRRAHQAVAARCRKATLVAKRALGREGPPEDCTGPKVATLPPEGKPLTDREWEILESLVPHKPPAGRPYHDHRTVLGGILWVARTGCSWRELPEEYGKWETVYRRYELWLKQGLWERILQVLGEEGLPGPTTKES